MISETVTCIEGIIREEGNKKYLKVETELEMYYLLAHDRQYHKSFTGL